MPFFQRLRVHIDRQPKYGKQISITNHTALELPWKGKLYLLSLN